MRADDTKQTITKLGFILKTFIIIVKDTKKRLFHTTLVYNFYRKFTDKTIEIKLLQYFKKYHAWLRSSTVCVGV